MSLAEKVLQLSDLKDLASLRVLEIGCDVVTLLVDYETRVYWVERRELVLQEGSSHQNDSLHEETDAFCVELSLHKVVFARVIGLRQDVVHQVESRHLHGGTDGLREAY